MAYGAKVVADSVSPAGQRLVTVEATLPRMVLAELNTHRTFSRNSASSRAIPVAKQLSKVFGDPFVPEKFGKNQPGMQSSVWLEGEEHEQAVESWLRARDRAATSAFELLLSDSLAGKIFGYLPGQEFIDAHQILADLPSDFELEDEFLEADLPATRFNYATWRFEQAQKVADPEVLGIHKQLCNRVLEPFMWHTVIITATEWDNFFALRAHKDAQAEIRKPAELIRQVMAASTPVQLGLGEWHTPYIQPQENFDLETRIKVSCGRCARVSYLTHDGIRDPDKDVGLYNGLVASGHMSPTEHAARPLEKGDAAKGNFVGWHQHRADLLHEENFGLINK